MENEVKVSLKVSSSVGYIPLADMPPVFEDMGIEISVSEDSELYHGLIAQFILQMIVEATSSFALEKLLLEPLLNLAKEKWKKSAKTLLGAFPNKRFSYSLIIRISDENLSIEVAPIFRKELSQRHPELDEILITDIWKPIQNTLSILKSSEVKADIRKIRIAVSDNKIDVICYENEKPSFLVDLAEKKLIQIRDGMNVPKIESTQDDEIEAARLGIKLLREMKNRRNNNVKP